MSLNLKNCSICLKMNTLAISVRNSDKNNVKWLTKLQSLISELEWLEEYMICESCCKKLETAWKFKTFVLGLEKNRRKGKSKGCSNLFDNSEDSSCDIGYMYEEEKKVNGNLFLKGFTSENQLGQHHKIQIHNEQLCYEAADSHDLIKNEYSNDNKEEGPFTCYTCSESFMTKNDLVYHIQNEHKGNKAYFDKLILQNHVEGDNLDSVDLENDLIDQFTSRNNRKRDKYEICLDEKDSKMNEKYYTHHCEKCGIGFSSINEFDLHNFSKHISKDCTVVKKRRGRKPLRKFNCEICNEEFGYVKLVIEHCVSIHSMNEKLIKPYSCEKCEMRFVSSANLDQHRNYHEKNRAHICSQCGKGFITKSDLTVHEYTHYNRRNYKCRMCDKAFNTNKNLRTHNLVVHTDRSLWKHVCSVCEKRFPLKTNYDQHFRRHTGEKEYACHICKKPFISKSELQRHVHMHSNIKAFKCSNCDKEYKERRTYQVHLAKKHGIGNAKITVREKKFVCHICPSQFYDKQKLMRHICSHSGLKPFPCFVCDKKFTDKSYLKHHLRSVHNTEEQLNNDVYNNYNKPFA